MGPTQRAQAPDRCSKASHMAPAPTVARRASEHKPLPVEADAALGGLQRRRHAGRPARSGAAASSTAPRTRAPFRPGRRGGALSRETGPGSARSRRATIQPMLSVWEPTTAVTGRPPKDSDLITRVVGRYGSRPGHPETVFNSCLYLRALEVVLERYRVDRNLAEARPLYLWSLMCRVLQSGLQVRRPQGGGEQRRDGG